MQRNKPDQEMRKAHKPWRRVPLTHASFAYLDHAFRQTLQRERGIKQAPRPLSQGSTALTWDDPDHFFAGLVTSQAVEAGGIAAGTPIPSCSGALTALVQDGEHA